VIPSTRAEALISGDKEYYTGVPCPKGHVTNRRTHNGECIACRAERLTSWRKRNPQAVQKHNQKQYQKYATHRHIWVNIRRKYTIANPDKIIAQTRAYQASKAKRLPKWLAQDDMWLIKEAYHLAKLRERHIGGKWHVDHIIPLRGEVVSGLHCVENLQVIPAIVNVQKSNKFRMDVV
jgi:hypothetical protein